MSQTKPTVPWLFGNLKDPRENQYIYNGRVVADPGEG